QYTYFPNSNGGIIDDLLLYMIDENQYLLVVNASNLEKDLNWIHSHNSFGCTIDNQSDNYSLLAVQGPKSIDLLQTEIIEKGIHLSIIGLIAIGIITFLLWLTPTKVNKQTNIKELLTITIICLLIIIIGIGLGMLYANNTLIIEINNRF
ncbi:MAG: hypothetical protein HRT73_15440, partial [Flavobacteriales bacterium]|nr:hypothetical protein [Flavobacteriales bacterium]